MSLATPNLELLAAQLAGTPQVPMAVPSQNNNNNEEQEIWPFMIGIRAAIKQWFQLTLIPHGLLIKAARFGKGLFVKEARLWHHNIVDRLIGVYGGLVIYNPKVIFLSKSDKIANFTIWNNPIWVDGNVEKGDDVGLLPALIIGENVHSVAPAPNAPEDLSIHDIKTWQVIDNIRARGHTVHWAAYMNHKWNWPGDPSRVPDVQSSAPLEYRTLFANCHLQSNMIRNPELQVGGIYIVRPIAVDEELTFDYGEKYWSGRPGLRSGGGRPIWDWRSLTVDGAMALSKMPGLVDLMKKSTLELPEGLEFARRSGVLMKVEGDPSRKKQKVKMANLALGLEEVRLE